MKKNSIIELELKKRLTNYDDGFDLIGPELKRRRTSQSQTLSSVASDVCSVSYLCKVEKNQLKPNRHMLQEICKKLNIENPNMTVLLKMSQAIINCVIAYTNNCIDEIDKIYNRVKEFDNYRTLIISFIHKISHKEFDKALMISLDLLKIVGTMKDYELNVFTLFYSILLYYEKKYIEVIDNLKSLIKLEKNEIILHLAEVTIFKSYFKLNHPFTVGYGEKLLSYFYDKTNVNKVELIRYYMGIYYLKNNLISSVENVIGQLKTDVYIESLKFGLDVLFKRKTKCNINKLRPMFKLIYYKFYNSERYRELYYQTTKSENNDLEYSESIASYFAINDDKERYRELVNCYLPEVSKSKDGYEIAFFMNEFCKSCVNNGRYKAFSIAYLDMVKEGLKL